jgi:hypothetical protein
MPRSSAALPVVGTPPSALNAVMKLAVPACAAASNGGRYGLAQGALETVGAGVVAPALGRAVGAEVLGRGHDRVGRGQSLPWNPRTCAAAIALPRNGSSPAPSTIRPQRGSRATSTIGAKVQCRPAALASAAAMRARARRRPGPTSRPIASGTGKIVR